MSYKAGKVALITNSVSTNTGIQLAIRTQNEILEAFPDLSNNQGVLSQP